VSAGCAVFEHGHIPNQNLPTGRQIVAARQFNSHSRVEVYRLIFLLNRSFCRAVQTLEDLGKTGILNARDLRDMRGLIQEIQTETNTLLLSPLESIESNALAHFGKIRTAMEKRLRGKG
jgi:hypothetical protein